MQNRLRLISCSRQKSIKEKSFVTINQTMLPCAIEKLQSMILGIRELLVQQNQEMGTIRKVLFYSFQSNRV